MIDFNERNELNIIVSGETKIRLAPYINQIGEHMNRGYDAFKEYCRVATEEEHLTPRDAWIYLRLNLNNILIPHSTLYRWADKTLPGVKRITKPRTITSSIGTGPTNEIPNGNLLERKSENDSEWKYENKRPEIAATPTYLSYLSQESIDKQNLKEELIKRMQLFAQITEWMSGMEEWKRNQFYKHLPKGKARTFALQEKCENHITVLCKNDAGKYVRVIFMLH